MTKKLITYERLREILNYNENTGLFTWRVRKGKRVSIGDVAGSINHDGYIRIKIDGRIYSLQRLAWLYTTGSLPPVEVDHINRNKRDNRLSNLRLATRAENMANISMANNNTSGTKGVDFHKATGKWQARCSLDGIRKYLGVYETLEEASEVYFAYAKSVKKAYFPDVIVHD